MSSLLAVDIGNSDVKFGLFEDKRLIRVERVPTDQLRGVDHPKDLLRSAPEALELLEATQSAAIGSVVSWAAARVASLLAGFGYDVRSLTSLSGFGLEIDYEHGEPGVDRVAACAEAFERNGGPLIVVGTGTAVHTNAVTADGKYLGGAIMPGARLLANALSAGTDQIRSITPTAPVRAIGHSTPECVQIGVYNCWLGGALRLIDQTAAELGGEPFLWLTGGHAEWLRQHLPRAQYDPHLALYGLAGAFLRGANRHNGIDANAKERS